MIWNNDSNVCIAITVGAVGSLEPGFADRLDLAVQSFED